MQIESLKVQNFRNLATQEIKFSDGLNVLFGKNAQGKTNTLESVYLLTIGRSPRTRKDSEMVAFKKSELKASISYSHFGVKHNLELGLSGGVKTVLLDGEKLAKISDIIGNFGSVYFSPEELRLVQGSPSHRRRYIDITCCQISKNYLKTLKRFQKVLEQRNALLKLDGAESQIEIWNKQLAEFGEKIIKERTAFFEKLAPVASEIHLKLSDGKEKLKIKYETIVFDNDIKEVYLSGLEKSYEKDKVLGYTNFGAQNDDFLVLVSGVDLRKNGSQGQQRTATLALKLAELELLKKEYGDYPVLLLDDVLSELDSHRRKQLLEHIKGIQCLITCTEFEEDLPCEKFRVENGTVRKEDKK